MSFLKSRFVSSLLLVTLLCGVTSAGTINLGSFMGANFFFNDVIENNGLPSNAPFPSLFNPTGTSGDMLLFNPTNFFVDDAPGGAPTILDHSLSFSVVAKPGQTIASVVIEEAFLTETVGSSALVEGFFGGPADTQNPSQIISESNSAQAGPNAGVLPLTPAPLVYTFPTPVTQANFTIDNRLTAFAGPSDQRAFIEKTAFKITVFPVPEPMSATIFACGFVGLLTVRRRKR